MFSIYYTKKLLLRRLPVKDGNGRLNYIHIGSLLPGTLKVTVKRGFLKEK